MPKPEDDGLLQRLEEQLQQSGQRRAPLTPKAVEPVKGDPGASAYEVAVANGFVGSEAAWLESLRGRDGTDGEDGESIKGDPGPKGKDGRDGKDGKDGKDGRDAPAPAPRRWAFAIGRDDNGRINEVIATPL
jgi:hypothetical protein